MSSIKEIRFRRAAQDYPVRAGEAGFFLAFRASVSGFVRAVLNRLAVNELHDLDDRMLDDIGLTRGELERVLATSGPFEDPTPGLARAVRARAWRRFSQRRG